jgi:protein-disulfide isomerase
VGAPPADAPFKGSKTATVVIQEFSDFQCPFCNRVNTTLAKVMSTYKGKVKLVWRHKPLPFHKDAPLAHEAAVEAYVQQGDAGFWKMHDKLFTNQKALKRADLEKYASQIGLNMTKFRAALNDRRHKARVEADEKASTAAGISGTPGFVINGFFISGAQPFSKFKKAIDVALAASP